MPIGATENRKCNFLLSDWRLILLRILHQLQDRTGSTIRHARTFIQRRSLITLNIILQQI
jgi:hypothetical protein